MIDLQKEAERITDRFTFCATESKERKRDNAFVLEILRAVHDAAIEEAAKVADDIDHEGSPEWECCGNENRIAEGIRALKIGDGK